MADQVGHDGTGLVGHDVPVIPGLTGNLKILRL